MLHTLSHTSNQTDTNSLLSLIDQQDAILLWQDGVTIAVKGNELLQNLLAKNRHIYVLKQDIIARGLIPLIDEQVQLIELDQCVALTVEHYPQLAW